MGKMQYLKEPPYFNGTIIAPDGKVLCRVDKKRIDWYLRKGLAEVVPEGEGKTIRLLFEPKDVGEYGDEYMLSGHANVCVVCGSAECLTMHHIVPYHYRKGFPTKLKEHASYDILPMCVPCHQRYETFANEFCKVVNADGVPCEQYENKIDVKAHRASCAARALIDYGHCIPEDRKAILRARVGEAFGKEEVSDEDLVAALGLQWQTLAAMNLRILAPEELEPFVRRWREHFLEKMKPRFLPKGWTADRNVNGKKGLRR
jgi:hypothetical protein